MSDTIVCPECGTEQSAHLPFCENCGYRLRSQRTVLEGLPSITADMLRPDNASVMRPERVSTEETPALDPDDVTGLPGDSDVDLDEGFVPNERLDPAPLKASKESQTMMEGVPAVGRRETLDETPAITPSMLTQAEPPPSMDASSSALIPAPSLSEVTERGPRRLVFGSLWLVTLVIAVLGTFFAVNSTSPGDISQDKNHAPTELQRLSIPAGPFLQGLDESTRAFILRVCLRVAQDPDEECDQDKLLKGEFPQETITLPAYAIDSQEVTNARYSKCVAAKKCEAADYKNCKVYTTQGLQIGLRVPKVLREPAHPQLCVRRSDAAAYCAFAGGALPSQAQWEKAARGEEGLLFPWGETWSPEWANWGEADVIKTPIVGKIDGFSWTAPPGQYPKAKSPYGLEDMAGNVAEWVVSDDPLLGIARGGSWTSDPFELRTTRRLEVKADVRRTDVGFRCVYAP